MLFEDRSGVLWIGTTYGLYQVAQAAASPVRAMLGESGPNPLVDNIQTIYEDEAGTLWVGTLGGLYRYTPTRKPFTNLRHAPEQVHSLSSNIVMAIHEDTTGFLWVGTLGGGLNQINRATGEIVHYRNQARAGHRLISDEVWAIHEDRAGRLWVGTSDGLCSVSGQQGQRSTRCERLVLDPKDPPYVNAIMEDEDGDLWVGGRFIYRLNPATEQVTRYVMSDPDIQVDIGNIQALYVASPTLVWIGTEFNNLYSLNPVTGAVLSYQDYLQTDTVLQGRGVRFIHADTAGVLWLGTDLGLVRFDSKQGRLRYFLQKDGLPGSIVYAILEDSQQQLWVSTNQGLARFDPRREVFRAYGQAEGTGNTEYNRRAAFKNGKGEFFFGGLNGLTRFFPEVLQDNPYVPPVVITKIEKSHRAGTVALPPFRIQQAGLTLEPSDYSFSIEFAALNFLAAEKNQYAYRLEGIDEGWVAAGTRRFVSYTGLSPGEYVFRVRGSNNDGVWNEEGTGFRVTIRPAFWQTWWFRALIVLAGIGFIGAAYRYRVAQLLKMERMRMRIANDLHDDIGSKLSSIALMSEMVSRRTALKARERRQLHEITEAARNMVHDLRDIVWLTNPSYDTLHNLVSKMEDVTAIMLDGVPYTLEVPDDKVSQHLSTERRRHLYLMYKEILHNIVQHASATEVTVHLAQVHDTLVLTVRDNGRGFDTEAASVGHGLQSLQERARSLDATLTLESQPQGGTLVQIEGKNGEIPR